jgi:hypothetical protein
MLLTEWVPVTSIQPGDRLVCSLSDAAAYPTVAGWHDEYLPAAGVTHRHFAVTGDVPWWVRTDRSQTTGSLETGRHGTMARVRRAPAGAPAWNCVTHSDGMHLIAAGGSCAWCGTTPSVWACCQHCHDHQTPWYGSDTLTPDGKHHTQRCASCDPHYHDTIPGPCICPSPELEMTR